MEHWFEWPFEARFWPALIGVGIAGGAIAWLLRLPLGRFRRNLIVLPVADIAGLWLACQLLNLIAPAAPWTTGLAIAPLLILIPTLCAADLVIHRLPRQAARPWLVPAAAGAILLGGAVVARGSADRAMADRSVRNLILSDHLSSRFWSDPLWNRLRVALIRHLPDRFDTVVRDHEDALLAALKTKDKAAIDRIDDRISSAFLSITEFPQEDISAASDTAILRYGRAHRAVLESLASDPAHCAGFAGLSRTYPGRDPANPDSYGALTADRQIAQIALIAAARANRANPPRTPPTEAERARIADATRSRLPPALARNPELFDQIASLDPQSQCAIALAWLDAMLAEPALYVRFFAEAARLQRGRFPR
jgi:hypothetical protein